MFRARPFRHTFPADTDAPPLTCEGTIQDGAFMVRVGMSDIVLPTLEIGSDEWGAFAVIDEWEKPLQSGFIVRVEPMRDEIDPAEPRLGCDISFMRPATLPPLIQDSVDRRGMTVDQVNVLVPPDCYFGFSFGHVGIFIGAFRMDSERRTPSRARGTVQ